MDTIEQIFINACKKEGVDLVGFAPRERFDGIDAPAQPVFDIPGRENRYHDRQAHLPRFAERR